MKYQFFKKDSVRTWFMPVILATWEAEIRRIKVQGQLGKQFARPHLQNNQSIMD
jgi:hypothetical protein